MIDYGDHKFTKINTFPLPLTDVSLVVSWYKLFKTKTDYHRIYTPDLEDYEIHHPYGKRIPQQMLNDPDLLSNHACAIHALLHHDKIVHPDFRQNIIYATENGYQCLYRIMEQFHPKLNPNITAEPPQMSTTSGTQHVQAATCNS